MWTLLPSNVAGRTKKSVTSTLLLIGYCAGNTIGAQVFQSKDAPTYIPAIVVCATMYGLEFVAMAAWRIYCEFPCPCDASECGFFSWDRNMLTYV